MPLLSTVLDADGVERIWAVVHREGGGLRVAIARPTHLAWDRAFPIFRRNFRVVVISVVLVLAVIYVVLTMLADILNAVLARDSARSFIPAMTLMVAYSIVFGYCAWNGPTTNRAGYTHLLFVPLILGVLSLPFVVFMTDRAFNLARGKQ